MDTASPAAHSRRRMVLLRELLVDEEEVPAIRG